MSSEVIHKVSVVIPVYQGEKTLPSLLAEIDALTGANLSPDKNIWSIAEVVLVYDNGPDKSDIIIRQLAETYQYIKPVWLSRNFGQHPATLAGIASTGSEWIVTIDEDGQQNPVDIGSLLDSAITNQAPLVYAKPTNEAPHGFLRNSASKLSKLLVKTLLGSSNSVHYNSFRLILGEVGRSASAYAGNGVYLDVALGWVASPIATAPVELREEGDRRSGYTGRKLLSHFWRMVVSSGTRSLRFISLLGVIVALLGVLMAIFLVINKLTSPEVQVGWTSTVTIMLFTSGLTMFSLGVIAEYLGVAVNMAMGRPLYLVTSDPHDGPLKKAPGSEDNRL